MMKILPKSKNEWKRLIKNVSLVLIGTFILAFGIAMFIFPFDLVTGGISGIGIILAKAFSGVPFLGDLGPDVYSSVINWILFALGFLILGKTFALNTLISTAFYPLALFISEYIVYDSPIAALLDLTKYTGEYQAIALIVATVFGGACIGAGCAFTFLGGGSTGGVDVIALTLSKYVKGLKSSVSFFICDTLIILIGVFAVDNFLLSLLGIISAFICAMSVDKLFLGESSAFIAHVVSDKYEEINRAVIEKMSRTTTIVEATGGYSGEGKKLVIITFAMRQYPAFTQLISSIDKNAFVTVHRAHEINGEGWTYEKN
ncbi:MAG: YitT family protein [Clostridia bacterium]|nr:YitT family protein [Clostridia bacterium]